MNYVAKVLIVDDTPENIGVLFELLNTHHFDVFIAQSGENALQIAESESPDIVLLDIMMPGGMDGFEVCRQLKANEMTSDIPVIFMTALAETGDKIRGFKLGAVDYVTKPFHQEEVLARIDTHLTLRALQQQLQLKNKHLQQEIEERKRIEEELQVANQTLQQLANLDGLTLIANRRRFDEYLTQSWQHHQYIKKPLALLFCDIDYFKNYNDHYGHLMGDDCLQKVATALSKATRKPCDLAARYGGEEFALVLPETRLEDAIRIAQRLQSIIADLKLEHASSKVSPYITLSIGVVVTIPTPEQSPQMLLAKADQALYRAKTQGRNQIVTQE